MASESRQLRDDLLARGVRMPAPQAVVLADLDPTRIAAGVVLHPGTTLCGRRTLLAEGTELGLAGGGCFQDIACGRGVQLWGGHHQDAVYLSGVRMRGQAEVRAGTLLEEGCQAGQHVGFKMTVLLANTAAGSLINFCDAIVAGGPSPARHSEIGSCMALYNFSVQGDKWASVFGDPVAGLLGRSAPVFVGGQSQVVSPVRVGPGTAIAAGGAVRRDVPAGRLYAEAGPVIDQPLDPSLYGPLSRKLSVILEMIGCLDAIAHWYEVVRAAWAQASSGIWEVELYRAAAGQLRAGIAERILRLDRLIGRLPESMAVHRNHLVAVDDDAGRSWHQACLAEQWMLIATWPSLRRRLEERTGASSLKALPSFAQGCSPVATPGATPLERVAVALSDLRRKWRVLGFQEAVALVDGPLLDDVAAALRAEVAGLATWDGEAAG